MARAFGDFVYKTNRDLDSTKQEVSCEPEIQIWPRKPKDNYLIFACDGIWDVFPKPQTLIPVLDDSLVLFSFLKIIAEMSLSVEEL